MKNLKKVFPTILILLVFSANAGIFSLPVLAYEKGDLYSKQSESSSLLRVQEKNNSTEENFSERIISKQLETKEGVGERKNLENFKREEREEKNYVEGEVLVKYKKNKINLETFLGRAAAESFSRAKSMEKKEDLKRINVSVLKIKDNKTVEEKIAELKKDPNVEYAEPNYKRYPAAIDSNDTYKNLLWGLDNTGQEVNGIVGTNDADIDAPEAWAISEGNSNVIVAVIDSGVAYNHPDLTANMWDGSTCVDENNGALGGCNHGYDYEDEDKIPLDNSGHGTHIAGTIGAVKNNNKGIIGVVPNIEIMAIKFGLDIATEIKSINFAISNGAKIINASFGGEDYSQAEYDAINAFKNAGGLFITAAGNSEPGNNNDAGIHNYPCDYNLDNIVCVAATDQDDNLTSWSNYGITSVDVGAPGVNIYSTIAQETIVLFENFEGVANFDIPDGWTKTDYWGVFNTGIEYWDEVLYGDVSHIPYEPSIDSTITSPTYNLSATGVAYIDFWTVCDTEYNIDFWTDYMALEISSDGSSFAEFGRFDEQILDYLNGDPLDPSGHAIYHFENISIPSQYLTNNFKFRFRWFTDSYNVPDINYNGCLIDDIKITKYSDGSDEKYGYMDGTSMAAAHASGLAALIEGYNPNLTTSQVKNIILNTGDDIPALHEKTSARTRINAQKALQAANPAKTITAFSFTGLDPVVNGVINEETHTVSLIVPFGTNVTALVPTIVINGASVNPASGVAQDFTNPVTYTVTAADGSTQAYVVTVAIATIISDPDAVAADKAALVDDLIRGANPDLSHITTALTNPLPASGSNGSTITWASDKTGVVSNDGQTVVRPAFELGNDTVTLTATLTKGVASDTKAFILTVLKLPASTVATITSATYTVSAGGTAAETITNVPFGTPKDTFLAALTKGQADQTWNDAGITDPVVSDNTLVVTAQDGVTVVTYSVTVNDAAPVTLSSIEITTPATKLVYNVGDPLDLTGLVVTGTYSDASTKVETITEANVTGFDSSIPVTGQVLTITVGEKTTTYTVDIVAVPVVDLSALTTAITSAQTLHDSATEGTAPGQYAVGSMATLQAAIDAATAVKDNPASTQADVDAAVTTLNDVVTAFEAGRVPAPDTTAPIITLLGDNPVNLYVDDSYTDAGATALDDVDGDITGSIVVGGDTVDTSTPGTYVITYNVSDTAGNPATEVTRTVIVSGGGGGGGGGGSGGGGAYTPPVTTPTTIKGDINKDNKVDKYDFALMMAAWGNTGSNDSDLNGDSKVDKYDFALLMVNWGTA